MRMRARLTGLMATVIGLPVAAQDGLEIIGRPVDKLLGFQPPVTELARDVQWLDNLVLWVIAAITILVTGLLIYVIFRYNEKANPTPSNFTHNSPLEVAWTVVPIVVLVFIGAFSLPVLFKQQEIPEGDIHIKVTGNQWYWGYEYTDHEFGFDSFVIAAGYSRDEFLLATDTSVVVPVNKVVVMDVTGSDVIHSWTIPAFGVKQDAVPGRIAQLWFKAEREGVYFGQCSEICGKSHAYMPITVKVVSQKDYDAWLAGAIDEYAGTSLDFKIASTK